MTALSSSFPRKLESIIFSERVDSRLRGNDGLKNRKADEDAWLFQKWNYADVSTIMQ